MSTIKEAREGDRARPVYLLEIALLNSGPTLYLSDRNITVGAVSYEDYLSGIEGLGGHLRRADSEGLNAEVVLEFRNERYGQYEYLVLIGETYPFEGAVCTVKEVYLDRAGSPSEAEVIFRGVLDEPRGIDLMRFACSVSSVEFRADLT